MFTVLEIAKGVEGSAPHEAGESHEAFLVRNLIAKIAASTAEERKSRKLYSDADDEIKALKAKIVEKDAALTLALRYVKIAKERGVPMEIHGVGGFGQIAAAMR